ncbi:uncharacterized protein LOC123508904 [Portunus trituberculatus]|uniref:uncharacterized protein LOC123508904 n=1 Tax=Portunus trituberculatus TaxID=210409 RepID=UPI001E1CB3FB|nr:uncharacterized protein LOC123508904 [Portunus trituberculatus]
MQRLASGGGGTRGTMACLNVWWSVVAVVGVWHAAQGAHLPQNTSDPAEDKGKPPFPLDLSSIGGETENNRLELLQELLDLSMKAEESENDIKTRLEKQKSAKEASSEGRGKKTSTASTTTTTATTSTTTTQPPPPPAAAPAAGTEEAEGGRDGVTGLQEYTRQELITLTHEGRRGNGSVMAGCPIPHLSIKTRCFANVMEVTVSSRMNLFGQLIMEGGDGRAEIKGAYLVSGGQVGGAGDAEANNTGSTA